MAPDPNGWVLVWNDEFDGDAIDDTKWAFHTGSNGFGNDELQAYTDSPDNAFVDDGELVIQAHENDVGEYTSAKLRTLGLASWTYGRFEVRARMPVGRGVWPAAWMMPEDPAYGRWPASGEIDIVELIGQEPDVIHTTLHWQGEGGEPNRASSSHTLPSEVDGGFAAGFHTYAVEWSPGGFRWLLDNRIVASVNEWPTEVGDAPAPFDQPFHLILNLAVGGRWPGSPDATTQFPQQFRIDYVRVYQPG